MKMKPFAKVAAILLMVPAVAVAVGFATYEPGLEGCAPKDSLRIFGVPVFAKFACGFYFGSDTKPIGCFDNGCSTQTCLDETNHEIPCHCELVGCTDSHGQPTNCCACGGTIILPPELPGEAKTSKAKAKK